VHRYVALLRGINVGGHRVKMDRLRELFVDLGFEDVETFIASGNVLFSCESADAGNLERRIEDHLAKQLGYDVATLLRTPDELSAVAAFQPTSDHEANEDASLYVMFLAEPADPELQAKLGQLTTTMDEFVFLGREIYWLIQGKLSDSPLFGGGITKAMRGVPNTARNMTTLRRLVAKMDRSG